MAKVYSETSFDSSSPEYTAIDLERMLERLQGILLHPDADTESKLHTSSYDRDKVGINLGHARTLLLRLEQDARNIKVQAKKYETQADLVRKRELIDKLVERLEEYNELGYDEEDGSSEGEDLLGDHTPSETDVSHTEEPPELTPPGTASMTESWSLAPSVSQREILQSTNDPEPASTIRARNPRAELFATAEPADSARSTGISTATTEALLTHNRVEQEALTASLLSMAQQLKTSSQSFATSLDDEKGILEGATKGMDKSEAGMEAAQRRMGYLRTLTEGKGWWGRMMLYAWIAGLMVLALVIVFVLPKLRF